MAALGSTLSLCTGRVEEARQAASSYAFWFLDLIVELLTAYFFTNSQNVSWIAVCIASRDLLMLVSVIGKFYLA
jgi:hypothetical protein